jgi:hypothetical protein
MCEHSYIKVSRTINMNMIFCRLLDDNSNEMEQICRFQRYCTREGKYVFNNENNCISRLMDGACKMQDNL